FLIEQSEALGEPWVRPLCTQVKSRRLERIMTRPSSSTILQTSVAGEPIWPRPASGDPLVSCIVLVGTWLSRCRNGRYRDRNQWCGRNQASRYFDVLADHCTNDATALWSVGDSESGR